MPAQPARPTAAAKAIWEAAISGGAGSLAQVRCRTPTGPVRCRGPPTRSSGSTPVACNAFGLVDTTRVGPTPRDGERA